MERLCGNIAYPDEARRSHVDGVICGHIHHAVIENFGDVQYINTGDWVESCTGVVEHHDGQFEIVRWTEARPHQMPGDASMVPFAKAVA